MENVGNEDYKELDVDDIEKKGLGTPATRSNIIENLVINGFIERKGKSLIPTEKGKNTIKIVDEKLKSSKMTAEWETKLQQIEQGNYNAEEFLREIIDFTNQFLENRTINEKIYRSLKKDNNLESLGCCPICSKEVYEYEKVYKCEDKNCRFVLFKNFKFFTKDKLTKTRVKELLSKGKTKMNFHSEKKNKDYQANVKIDITDKCINFKKYSKV